MLSILIPTYNHVCLPLVNKLHAQAVVAGVAFELLLADDASREEVRKENSRMADLPACRYLQLEENIGPARIRNYLARQAQYPYLLFLDDDAMPVNDTFIVDYLHAAQPGAVVCGGFSYPRLAAMGSCLPTTSSQLPATPDAGLRYRYGTKVEEKLCRSAHLSGRMLFFGICFLAPASLFGKVSFDESFGFGYEDLAFGVRLKQAGFSILYVDNPVYHLTLETSEQYLEKTQRAVRNLSRHMEQMQPYVRLLQWHAGLRRFGLVSLTAFLFRQNEKRLVRNLTSPHPSLKLFAFYKLGYLCTLKQSNGL